jgi:hypothetical protein
VGLLLPMSCSTPALATHSRLHTTLHYAESS